MAVSLNVLDKKIKIIDPIKAVPLNILLLSIFLVTKMGRMPQHF